MWARRSAAFSSALAICFGCTSPTPTERSFGVGARSSAIQGGALDRSHTFAVAILDDEGICSGALIAPNLVLTARHCVDPGGSDAVDCRSDTFAGTYPASRFRITTDAIVSDASPERAVRKILVPAAKKFCGNDIALLVLEDVIPAEEATPIAPAVEFPMTDHPRYGSEVAVIGYGITGPSKRDDGTRRLRENVAIECTPGDETNECSSLADYDMTATEFVIEEGVCTGDSGGSAIDQGSLATAPVTFGVLSRAGETSTRCTEAIFTRTDAFKEFLVAGAEEAATLGGYPKPLWAGGTPPSTEPDALDGSAAPATSASAPAPAPNASDGCSAAPSCPGSAGLGGLLFACLASGLFVRRRGGLRAF